MRTKSEILDAIDKVRVERGRSAFCIQRQDVLSSVTATLLWALGDDISDRLGFLSRVLGDSDGSDDSSGGGQSQSFLFSATKGADGYWIIDEHPGRWVWVKNLGKWSDSRTYIPDDFRHVVAVISDNRGYAGLFGPVSVEVTPDPIPVPEAKVCYRHKPFRDIGKLRVFPGSSDKYYFEEFSIPELGVDVMDDDLLTKFEQDSTHPLGRYKYHGKSDRSERVD